MIAEAPAAQGSAQRSAQGTAHGASQGGPLVSSSERRVAVGDLVVGVEGQPVGPRTEEAPNIKGQPVGPQTEVAPNIKDCGVARAGGRWGGRW